MRNFQAGTSGTRSPSISAGATRFSIEPGTATPSERSTPARRRDAPVVPPRAAACCITPSRGSRLGHVKVTPTGRLHHGTPAQRCDLDFSGGDDGTRTHDPLLAKQV